MLESAGADHAIHRVIGYRQIMNVTGDINSWSRNRVNGNDIGRYPPAPRTDVADPSPGRKRFQQSRELWAGHDRWVGQVPQDSW
jgi:hypothetical protein